MTELELCLHLAERGCDVRQYRLSVAGGVAVFPLWNFGGKLKGYQQYRPFAPKKTNNPKEARYFTRSFEPCLWGLEYLPPGGTVFVAESIFKACALHKAGVSAVACLGSAIPSQHGNKCFCLHIIGFASVTMTPLALNSAELSDADLYRTTLMN
ncbi:TPA: toprim domain-containing protein [Salmonella enterica subsp. enterica serovar Infantis]|nr:toprim domain-containing protein [Salmonella enterica subsp. enterica serovar Infantis]HCI4149802.1 toprim domain-containing protein [Salmonella enterica subsp. enterica serovar Infantis]